MYFQLRKKTRSEFACASHVECDFTMNKYQHEELICFGIRVCARRAQNARIRHRNSPSLFSEQKRNRPWTRNEIDNDASESAANAKSPDCSEGGWGRLQPLQPLLDTMQGRKKKTKPGWPWTTSFPMRERDHCCNRAAATRIPRICKEIDR